MLAPSKRYESSDQRSQLIGIAHTHHTGSQKPKQVLPAPRVRGFNIGFSSAPSNGQISPPSQERHLENAISLQPRANIDPRKSDSRPVNSQPKPAGSTVGHVPLSKHLRTPSQYRNGSKLPSRSQIVATTTAPLDDRKISKIGLPAHKSKNPRGVSKTELADDESSDATILPQRNVFHRTIRSTSSVPTGLESSAESAEVTPEGIRQLQGKLLQLHILHSASTKVHQQWRESAKQHFKKQFDELVERHAEIADIAYQTQELKNRSALVDWCRDIQGPEVARRVRTLSRCIQGIYENLDPGGKYNQMICSFDIWFARAREVQEARKTCPLDQVTNSTYVEEIGAGWQNDVDALQRRLSTLTGDLRTLGSASTDSTLGQLLVMLQDLVIDMLAEADCIRSIECEIVGQEEVWMEEQIRNLSLKVHNEMGSPRKSPKKRRDIG